MEHTDPEMRRPSEPGSENPEGSWYDFLTLLLRWKGFILKTTLIVTAFSVVLSLVLPRWYKSTTSILPPKETNPLSQVGAAGSILRSLTSGGRLSALMPSQGLYNYLAILNSRSAMEAVIRQFDLFSVYDIPDTLMESAVKALTGNVEFEIEPEEYLTITVYDKNPQRAADMANSFADVLNSISIQLATRNARSNREFLEQQVAATKTLLKEKEDSLKAFQERTGMMVLLDENAKGLSPVAELYAAKALKEVELGIAQRMVSTNEGLLENTRVELEELNKKVSTIPETSVQSMRLLRDVLIHQRVLEFLVPLYEQAKIDEQKEVPVLLVLDRGVPAEKKASPQRSLIVLSALFASLVGSIGWAITSERYQRLISRRPEVETTLRSLLRVRKAEKNDDSGN